MSHDPCREAGDGSRVKHTAHAPRAHARSAIHTTLINKNMISKLTIQKVKDAANIVDVIRDFLTLKKKGTHYECLCPFHDDHHIGSFVVSRT